MLNPLLQGRTTKPAPPQKTLENVLLDFSISETQERWRNMCFLTVTSVL